MIGQQGIRGKTGESESQQTCIATEQESITGALLPTLQANRLREGLTDYLATTFALISLWFGCQIRDGGTTDGLPGSAAQPARSQCTGRRNL
ncbi:hypothetical protein [Nocardia nova]|uniref:hypothetical protein n=1 Tax=Nocardia nova TaxID=37330 RepID=UPI002738803A|nr:hypothetical protein [Nocardia nova]